MSAKPKDLKPKPGIFRRAWRNFWIRVLTGATVVVPIGITLWAIVFAFQFVDGLTRPTLLSYIDPQSARNKHRLAELQSKVEQDLKDNKLASALDRISAERDMQAAFKQTKPQHDRYPGLGLVVAMALLFLIGVVASNIAGRKVIGAGEALVGKIPVIRSLFKAFKQIVEAVFTPRRKSFKRVVLIEFPRRGLWALAFVMGSSASSSGARSLSLFIPTTPNPTSGYLEVVPEQSVLESKMSVEDGLRLVASAGMLVPERLAISLGSRR